MCCGIKVIQNFVYYPKKYSYICTILGFGI